METTSASVRGAAGRSALAALVAVLCVAVGFGSGRSLVRVGGPGRLVDASGFGGDVIVVALASLLAIAGAIAYAVLPARRRRRDDDEPEQVVERPPAPWWFAPATVVLMLAGVAGIVAALLFLPRHASELGRPRGGATFRVSTSPAGPGSAAGHRQPAAGVGAAHWWVLAALGGLVLVGIALVWWRGRRMRTAVEEQGSPTVAEELRTAVELSIEDVEAEADPRRAVLKAYRRMETTLAGRGIARRASETSLEYLARTLRTFDVGAGAARGLTQLFQRAKFSRQEVDPGMKAAAIAALRELRDDLEAAR